MTGNKHEFKESNHLELWEVDMQLDKHLDLSQDPPDIVAQFYSILSEAAREHYGDDYGIPDGFTDEHPNILFIPLGLNRGQLGFDGDKSQLADVERDLNASDLRDLSLVDEDSLTQVLVWVHENFNDLNEQMLLKIYDYCAIDFFSNLKLYHLLKDKDQIIYRFAHSEREEEIPHDEGMEIDGYLGLFPDFIRSKAKYKIATYWTVGYKATGWARSVLREMSVGEALENYSVALDKPMKDGVVLIRRG